MSVNLVRELIDRIMKTKGPDTQIFIQPGNEFLFCHFHPTLEHPDTYSLHYSLRPEFAFQSLSDGIQSLSNPSVICLAHELLHLSHSLDGTFYHLPNPYLDRSLHTSEEESRAIRNTPCCSMHNPDPCNEETLRTQLGYPIRVNHLHGIKPEDPPDLAYMTALLVGSTKDAERAFSRGISYEVLMNSLPALPADRVVKFMGIAASKLAGACPIELPPSRKKRSGLERDSQPSQPQHSKRRVRK